MADATAVRLPEQDVVTLFFPFLTPYACLRWGAPLSRMRPQRLVERAVRALNAGILFLALPPAVVLTGLGLVYWKNR